MFDVRKIWQRIPLSVLCLLAMSIFVNAQDKDKDQAKNKDSNSKKASANYIKVDGKMHCDKPETEHSIEVPDRPGHVLMLTKRKCTWTEPISDLSFRQLHQSRRQDALRQTRNRTLDRSARSPRTRSDAHQAQVHMDRTDVHQGR